MKLFSEEVQQTSTNSSHNILQVEHFSEIFFDIFEVEINKSKYPVEKISVYEGSPVVSVPVLVDGVEIFYPFVLIEGSFGVFFNKDNTLDKLYPDHNIDHIKESLKISDVEEIEHISNEYEVVEETFEEIVSNKEIILKQIEKAKRDAKKSLIEYKAKLVEKTAKDVERKNQLLKNTLEKARESLVHEFIDISDKLKSELRKEYDENCINLREDFDQRLSEIYENLENQLEKNFENSSTIFDNNLKLLVKKLYSETISPKVEKDLEEIAVQIVEKVDKIEANLDKKLDSKAEITLVKGVSNQLENVQKANIELNDNINKGINKALSRAGNVKTLVEKIDKEINKKIDTELSNIEKYFDERIIHIQEKTFDITEESRKYIVDLVNKSKVDLLEEIKKIQREKPVEYILETKKKDPEKVNIDKLKKEYDSIIHDKFENYKTDLRKYIAVYSGGGSVAQQFADGGTMNGNLTVVGSISASQYLGIEPSTTSFEPVSSLQFVPLTSTPVYEEGKIFYDKNESTITIYGDNPNTSLQVGKELWIRVVNKTNSAITDGTVVYLSGAQGSRPKAWPAIATDEESSHKVIGVATENIDVNAEGHVTVFGSVNGINMSSYNDGDILYVSPTIAGGLTNVRPPLPYHSIKVGNVIRNQNNGSLLVSVDTGSDLKSLHDVSITNPQNGDALVYDTLSGGWINKNISSDPVRTTLTGNGSLSTFSISGANNLVNPSALIVAIDGALQEPVVDYTVSSGQITFTSPLPSGSKAVVISPTNSLQVSQMIPADGSVTSEKLDTNIEIAGNLVTVGKMTANGQGSWNALGDNDIITKTILASKIYGAKVVAPSSTIGFLPLGFGRLDTNVTVNGGYISDTGPATGLPFLIQNAFNKISINHKTGTHPTAYIEIGVYDSDSTGNPSSLIEKGVVTLNSTGYKTLRLSQSYTIDRLFYVFLRVNIGIGNWTSTGGSGSLTVVGYAAGSSAIFPSIFGAVNPTSFDLYMGTSLPKYLSYNPLPSSMSGLFIRDPSSNQQTPACVIHA